MDSALIVVASMPPARGRWTAHSHLRIGRMAKLDIVLNDDLVSRLHAEIVHTDDGWVLRDLGSQNGTDLNGCRVGRTGQRLRCGDVFSVGGSKFRIDHIRIPNMPRVVEQQIPARLETSASRSWKEAVEALELPDHQWQQHGKSLLKLMRTSCRLAQANSLDEILPSLLATSLNLFQAQCAGMLLSDPITAELRLRGVVMATGSAATAGTVSRSLADRAFQESTSLLFSETAHGEIIWNTDSISRSNASSVICATLRSAERTLGVLQLLRTGDQPEFTAADLYLADSVAAVLALGIERQLQLEQEHDQLVRTVTVLAQAMEMRDRCTGCHTDRVARYSQLLARELNLSDADCSLLRLAVPLHDIGKIAIEDAILRKANSLSAAEFEVMKSHVTVGADIIRTMPNLAATLPVVLSHHEWWNGNGYPEGLRGEAIPLLARVVSVADAFDAMTSDRPYRAGLPAEKAFSEILKGSGTQFDPRCVEALLRVRSSIEALLNQDAQFHRMSNMQTHTISRKELVRRLQSSD